MLMPTTRKITVLATVLACSPAAPQPSPTPSRSPVDYAALDAAIENAITTGPATLTFTDTGRTPGTTYAYTVTAIDAIPNSSVPASVSAISFAASAL